MNGTELAVAGVLVAWLVAGHRSPRLGALLATSTVAGGALLLLGPRWRWQLWPLLVAVALAAVVEVSRGDARSDLRHGETHDDRRGLAASAEPRTTRGHRPGRGIGTAVTVGIVLTALSVWVLPVPTMALEPGSPPVGTVAFDLVDPDRSARGTSPDEPRRITVQAWWPAAGADGPTLPITTEGPALAVAAGDFLGLPSFVLGHVDAVRTAAHVGAPPADVDPLPVVLSLHGWGGFRFAQVGLLEQLAADGFLVLAIDHTHGALAAQPAAGGVVPIDESLLPDDAPQDVYDAAATALEDTFRGDAATLLTALRAADSAVPQDVLVLADLDRLVVMGHSTGGGAAVWWCSEEPACDGLLTWDPWVEPVPADRRGSPPAIPWLSVLSEGWIGNDNDGLLRPMVDTAPDAEVLAILGTEHRDVTVQPLLSPLAPVLGLAGDLPKQRTDEIALMLTRAFLAEVVDTGPGDPTDLVEPPAEVVRP